MTATPFDSAHLHQLFPTNDTGRLFSDTAEIRAMMLVEGALAQVQAAHGVIPQDSADAIHRAGLEIQIDPGALAKATGQNGVCTPALVTQFRAEMQAPEHAQYLHWGATSQDIQDTGQMLRLRQALSHQESRIKATLTAISDLAKAHADTPMAARTYGQHATPTSFGAQVAAWGWPLINALQEIETLRETCLLVSLSGAAGTGSELGTDPAAIRADLATKLGLKDPKRSWHSDRSPLLKLTDWFTRSALAAGKMGEDLVLATQSGLSEVALGGTGASSTMPQKQNPVAPSALVALARHAQGLNATLQGASLHRWQRDGAAWFTEWLTLPQLVLTASSALVHAQSLAESIAPDAQAMAQHLTDTGGLILAEALSFELAKSQPRPEAQAQVKALCATARENGEPLETTARAALPDLPTDFFDSRTRLGTAPAEALHFVQSVAEVV
ncbi:MAG: lyase family protein [Pelagimonas sp.]|jgi:3-carboxy-cis,cis-muconate cycloisomerase|nr:lyase family protein [Pelagimonas sp.]